MEAFDCLKALVLHEALSHEGHSQPTRTVSSTGANAVAILA